MCVKHKYEQHLGHEINIYCLDTNTMETNGNMFGCFKYSNHPNYEFLRGNETTKPIDDRVAYNMYSEKRRRRREFSDTISLDATAHTETR